MLIDAVEQLRQENEQLRSLLNLYNLGGWTDSLRLMQERDAARQDNQRQKDEWLSWAAKREALERDAARYLWLRDVGPKRQIGYTPSYSIGKGPYIYMTLPSVNPFNGVELSGPATDSIVDAAMKEHP